MGTVNVHFARMAHHVARVGWGGKGKPYSLRFGLACGSTFALMLVVGGYTNHYVGVGVWLALICFGMRTKFFARRMEQLKAPTTE